MNGHIADYFWTSLPHFLGWFAFALLVIVAFLAVYVTITPHKEFTLIKAGNSAAATQLILSALGFALPFAVAISHSVSILDALYWGLAALVFFLLARILLPGVEKRIEDNCMASGITIGGLSLVAGVLMAGCMVP